MKQIEEMAEKMIEIQQNFNEYCAKPCRECELGGVVNCESHYKAEALYNAGYRKQSEIAREIFELIDCAFSPVLVYNGYTVKEYLAELKKKYKKEE